jgi:hypothetical protein
MICEFTIYDLWIYDLGIEDLRMDHSIALRGWLASCDMRPLSVMEKGFSAGLFFGLISKTNPCL